MSRDPGPDVFLSIRVSVFLPLAQALASGFFFGILTVALAYFFSLPNPWTIGAVIGTIAALVSWVLGLRWWQMRVLTILGHAPWQRPEPALTKIELRKNDGRTLAYVDLPASDAQLRSVANLVINGGNLSQDNLHRIFHGSRPEISAFQSALVEHRYAEWRNAGAHAQGIRLTDDGMAVFEQLASPLPESAPMVKLYELRGHARARVKK